MAINIDLLRLAEARMDLEKKAEMDSPPVETPSDTPPSAPFPWMLAGGAGLGGAALGGAGGAILGGPENRKRNALRGAMVGTGLGLGGALGSHFGPQLTGAGDGDALHQILGGLGGAALGGGLGYLGSGLIGENSDDVIPQ